MDNIGIISNNDNTKALNISKDIYDYLISKGINVCLLKDDALADRHLLPSIEKDEFEKIIGEKPVK